MLVSWEERRKEVKELEGRHKEKGREEQKREKEQQIAEKGICKVNSRLFQKTKNLELNKKILYFSSLILGANLIHQSNSWTLCNFVIGV